MGWNYKQSLIAFDGIEKSMLAAQGYRSYTIKISKTLNIDKEYI